MEDVGANCEVYQPILCQKTGDCSWSHEDSYIRYHVFVRCEGSIVIISGDGWAGYDYYGPWMESSFTFRKEVSLEQFSCSNGSQYDCPMTSTNNCYYDPGGHVKITFCGCPS